MMQGPTRPKLPLKRLILPFVIAAAVVGGFGAVAGPQRSDGSSAFVKPTTQAALQAALQAGFDNCYVTQLDPTTNITASSTIALTAKNCAGRPRGFNGNGASISSTINDGSDVMTITSTGEAKNLFIAGIHIYGGMYEGKVSGNCLFINAPKNLAIYTSIVKDLVLEYCGHSGLAIKGDFFESVLDNINTQANFGDGIWINHGDDGRIISNVMIRSPNISRNRGYGLHAVRANSIDISQGSVINNWLGGLLGEHGLRTVDSINCENTGPVCVTIPQNLAFETGAVDFIDKARGVEILARRLRRPLKAPKSAAPPPPASLEVCGKLVLNPNVGRAYWNDLDVGLTLGEYNIVHHLASNAGRWVTYRAIYDQVHYEGFIGGSGEDGYRINVRGIIKRIRKKFLQCDETFAEIDNVVGFGYRWANPTG